MAKSWRIIDVHTLTRFKVAFACIGWAPDADDGLGGGCTSGSRSWEPFAEAFTEGPYADEESFKAFAEKPFPFTVEPLSFVMAK